MWNLQNDNELDKLSREAAENYPLDQEPGSWDKLQQRLDEVMPKNEKRRRRIIFFFLLFCFLGSGGFWLSRMGDDDANTKDQLATNSNKNEKVSEAKKAEKGKTTPAGSVQSGKQNATKADAKLKPTTESTVVTTEEDSNQELKTAQQRNNTTTIDTKYKTVINTREKKAGANESVKGNKAAAFIGVSQSGQKSNLVTSQKSVKQKTKGQKSIADTKNQYVQDGGKSLKGEANEISKFTYSDPLAIELDPVVLPLNYEYVENLSDRVYFSNTELIVDLKCLSFPIVDKKSSSRWAFGLSYAPDLTTVKFTHTQPPGHNLGVTVEYNLSERFSIQSGAFYTIKKYKVDGEDYHPPKGYWTDYVKLEDVTGDCTMWDIPLNLRYNAINKKSSKIFITTGLSSYLMKEEDYYYYYYYNNGTPGSRERKYETNENYWFSILNVSIGLEKELNKQFSIQLEPFFKQSLKGVGFGSTKLNSTGVYFSLRYRPSK